MGSRGIHTEYNFAPRTSKLSLKLSSTRCEKAGDHRSYYGIFCAKRDYEPGMVTADCRDDDEYWSLDSARRVDCNSHRQVNKSIEGVIGSVYEYSYSAFS